MKKVFDLKKYWIIMGILVYCSIFYLTFLIMYLSKNGDIEASFKIEHMILNLYIAGICTLNVRYLFKNIFLNKYLSIISFYPVKFKKMLFSYLEKSQFLTILIILIYPLSYFLVFDNLQFILKETIKTYLLVSIFSFLFVEVLLFGIRNKKINQLQIYIFEVLLYCFSVIIMPSVVYFLKKFFCIYYVCIIASCTFLLFFISEESYQKIFDNMVLYNYMSKTKGKKNFNDIHFFLKCKNPYLQIEIKRYKKIYKIVVSSLIQFLVLSTVLFILYKSIKIERLKISFILLNVLLANNFFATTSWSSDGRRNFQFLPISIIKLAIIKIIIAALLQLLIFTISYIVFLTIFSNDLDMNAVLLYSIMFMMNIFYSFLGCILDLALKRKIFQLSDLIYGNLPKLILIIISLMISNSIYNFLVL